LTRDSAGNLYIGSQRIVVSMIRGEIVKVAPSGTTTLLYTEDRAYGSALPFDLAVGANGGVFFSRNCEIDRVIDGTHALAVAGAVRCGNLGSGLPAPLVQMGTLVDLTNDPCGNIFALDQDNSQVWRIDRLGIASVVAGTGSAGIGPDGVASASPLDHPSRISVDPVRGKVYVADQYRVRAVAGVTCKG
jgi:hypothetical protein